MNTSIYWMLDTFRANFAGTPAEWKDFSENVNAYLKTIDNPDSNTSVYKKMITVLTKQISILMSAHTPIPGIKSIEADVSKAIGERIKLIKHLEEKMQSAMGIASSLLEGQVAGRTSRNEDSKPNIVAMGPTTAVNSESPKKEEINWQIESFLHKDGRIFRKIGIKYKEEKNNLASFFSLQEMLFHGDSVSNGNIRIRTVQRLNDGKIFSIGENVTSMLTWFKEPRIKRFLISPDNEIKVQIGNDTEDTERTDTLDILSIGKKECKPADKKPEYQILSFKGKKYPTLRWNLDSDNKYRGQASGELFSLFGLLKDCEILSVKRFSDGEIFTLEDKNITAKDWNFKGQITRIDLVEGRIYININSSYSSQALLRTPLKHVIKFVPLFTSADGVPIFPGHKGYYVRKDWSIGHAKNGIEQKWGVPDKYFHSLDKAKDYVIENIPSLPIDWKELSHLHYYNLPALKEVIKKQIEII